MNMVMTSVGRFVEVQGTGDHATFTAEQLASLLQLAQAGIRQLLEVQRLARIDPTG